MATSILLAAALAACGGSSTAEGVPAPVLAELQEVVFVPACATSGCHDAAVAGGGLDMSTAQASYDGMVNVQVENRVARANGWVNVIPGDPDRSFLIRKLDGPGLGEGDPMPSAAKQLSAPYRDAIVEWIVQGAQR